MAFGPYGTTDWPAGCDPYWSDLNGYCSDFAGDYIDTRSGKSVNSLDLTRLLTGIQNAITPKPAQTTQPAGSTAPPAPKKQFDLQEWFKTGYNLVYVSLGFLALILMFALLSRGKK